ncbi:TadE/TadG family type IV pilus assembly protein [Streptomyces sp. NPDC050560]|uniref:TadE/TadG family type IV pilus assembly protein n=1 Tax=Streptomyces sp. NPDC050560 TaxID=3365630 RepID=UPI0037AAE5D0
MTAFLRRLRGDRGAVSTQLVVVVPLLLLLALLVVQFALAWHARHIAQFAAQRALASARVEKGSAAEGRTQGLRTLAALGHTILAHPSVHIDRGAARATARVSGEVERVLPIPGLTLHASGTAEGPVEKTTLPPGGH